MFNKLFKRKPTKIEGAKNTMSDNVPEKEEANELSFKLHYRNENGELCEFDPWDEDAFDKVICNEKNHLVFM